MTLTVEGASPVSASPLAGAAAHLLREVPIHGLMIGVMAVAMVEGSVVISVLGAAMLLAASVVCAALSRARPHFREHVLDLWAMALVLLIFLPMASVSDLPHSHLVTLPSLALFASVMVLWAVARACVMLGQRSWRASLASGAVTAVGLAIMAVFCR